LLRQGATNNSSIRWAICPWPMCCSIMARRANQAVGLASPCGDVGGAAVDRLEHSVAQTKLAPGPGQGPPTRPAHRSLSTSPNRFSITARHSARVESQLHAQGVNVQFSIPEGYSSATAGGGQEQAVRSGHDVRLVAKKVTLAVLGPESARTHSGRSAPPRACDDAQLSPRPAPPRVLPETGPPCLTHHDRSNVRVGHLDAGSVRPADTATGPVPCLGGRDRTEPCRRGSAGPLGATR